MPSKILDPSTEKELMRKIGFLLAQKLEERAPFKTGFLSRSFYNTLSTDNDSIRFTLPEYAKYIEFGTKSHIIKPKNKKALFWKGAAYPVKQVNHPGTKPNPFIRTTLHQDMDDIIKKAFKSL